MEKDASICFDFEFFRLHHIAPCKNESHPLGFIIKWRFDLDNYTFRLKPGDDPSGSINSFVRGKNIEAGCVLDRRFVLSANGNDSGHGGRSHLPAEMNLAISSFD